MSADLTASASFVRSPKAGSTGRGDRSPSTELRSPPSLQRTASLRRVASTLQRKSSLVAAARSDPSGQSEASNYRVVIRIRPFLPNEILENAPRGASYFPSPPFEIDSSGKQCTFIDPATNEPRETFVFDSAFCSVTPEQWGRVLTTAPSGSSAAILAEFSGMLIPPTATQSDLFETCGRPVISCMLDGYNASVLAYGQTSSGKTFTMMGEDGDDGIIPRLCKTLFEETSHRQATSQTRLTDFTVDVEFFEIYNEAVLDLLAPMQQLMSPPTSPGATNHRRRKVRNHPVHGVYVEGLVTEQVSSWEQCEELIARGANLRHTASTRLNETSSRSHAIFQMRYIQTDITKLGTVQRRSNVHLADLAGSERVKLSASEGERFREATQINQSLTTLRRVIDTLIGPGTVQRLPPYRDSMLTWVLSESLGGNAKAFLIATVCPHPLFSEESYNTLVYAARAKLITNSVVRNEDAIGKMIRELQDTIAAQQTDVQAVDTAALELRNEELRVKQETIENLLQQQRSMEERFLSMTGELSSAKERLEQGKYEREAQAAETAMLSQSIRELTAHTEKQSDQNVELRRQLTSISDENEVLRKQLHSLQRENMSLHQRVNSERKTFSRLADDYERWSRNASTLLIQCMDASAREAVSCFLRLFFARQHAFLSAEATCEAAAVAQREAEARMAAIEGRSNILEDVNYDAQEAISCVAEKYVQISRFLDAAQGGLIDHTWSVSSIIRALRDFCDAAAHQQSVAMRSGVLLGGAARTTPKPKSVRSAKQQPVNPRIDRLATPKQQAGEQTPRSARTPGPPTRMRR